MLLNKLSQIFSESNSVESSISKNITSLDSSTRTEENPLPHTLSSAALSIRSLGLLSSYCKEDAAVASGVHCDICVTSSSRGKGQSEMTWVHSTRGRPTISACPYAYLDTRTTTHGAVFGKVLGRMQTKISVDLSSSVSGEAACGGNAAKGSNAEARPWLKVVPLQGGTNTVSYSKNEWCHESFTSKIQSYLCCHPGSLLSQLQAAAMPLLSTGDMMALLDDLIVNHVIVARAVTCWSECVSGDVFADQDMFGDQDAWPGTSSVPSSMCYYLSPHAKA